MRLFNQVGRVDPLVDRAEWWGRTKFRIAHSEPSMRRRIARLKVSDRARRVEWADGRIEVLRHTVLVAGGQWVSCSSASRAQLAQMPTPGPHRWVLGLPQNEQLRGRRSRRRRLLTRSPMH